MFVLKVQQPGWFLAKAYYNDTYKPDVMAAYKQFMFDFAKLMGSTYTDDEIKEEVKETYLMENSLAQVGKK